MAFVNRILIIDDDEELCALVTRFLRTEGFAIDRAADASQGIGLASSGSYALIMLDVMMPDLNGFDVLRRIRARSRTPVLMLTARGDTHDRVLGLELGADDYPPNRTIPRSWRRAFAPFSADRNRRRRAPPLRRRWLWTISN